VIILLYEENVLLVEGGLSNCFPLTPTLSHVEEREKFRK
jgi:hypothetical protein